MSEKPPHATPLFAAWRCFFAPPLRRAASTHRSGLVHATLTQIEQRFAPVLPASLLGQNSSRDHSRERIFTLARTVWCWLWQALQAHASCREAVQQVQALFALHQAGDVDSQNSAYCQARDKIPAALLQKLFQTSAGSVEQAAPGIARPLLQNRRVQVVDASGTRLPDTAKNRAAFPPSANLPAGTGFPYLRLVVLFSLASGALLAQASGAQSVHELRLLFSLLPHLQRGDILLGDRSYGCYVVAAVLQSCGVDLLSTVSTRCRKVDFRRAAKRLGPMDALFVWKKPSSVSPLCTAAQWRALPAEIFVRLLRVRVARRGFRASTLVVVTTLLDPHLYPAAEIVATHARRWRLEMCLDDVKTTLGMEGLRCQSPAMVKKELLVFLTAYNLIRWLMAQVATEHHVALERLSFKGTLDGFRQWSHTMAQRRSRAQAAKLWPQFLASIAADLLPERPGRHEPRAVKKRSKYPRLNKPRHSYVDRWSRGKRRRVATAKRRASA